MTVRIAAPARVLLIQLRRLGDMVITTALLDDLRQAFPAARLDFMTRAAIAPVLTAHPVVSEVIPYDRERPVRMWAQVRARRYDWVIDSESSPRSALLTRASGARVRVGWRVTGWQLLYTHRASRTSGRPPEYVVLDRQRLLDTVGVPTSPRRPRLSLTDEERRSGEGALVALNAPPGAARMGLVLSAGDRSKEWPVEHFASMAAAAHAAGMWPVVFEMPGDSALVARLRAAAPRTPVASGRDIRAFMGMLTACDVIVSADTGPAHVATALDVPTVTVFGPEDPAGWSPRIAITAVVRGDLAGCAECARRARGVPHSCMAGVSPDTVLARARALLAVRTNTAAEARLGFTEAEQ